MPYSDTQDSPGYSHPTVERNRSVDVLNAMRDYGSAEGDMRRRMRTTMNLGENDISALRFLLGAKQAGRNVSPSDLARSLHITTASTTLLIDRLVSSGHVVRSAHATDRRALVIVPTGDSFDEMRNELGGMHEKMMIAAGKMSAKESATVLTFLAHMQEAMSGN